MIEKRVTSPFMEAPAADPAPAADGLIWATPHAHVAPVADVFETIQQGLVEARAGSPILLISAWMHLTHQCFTGGQLALCRRALVELSTRLKNRMIAFRDQGRAVSLPPWAATLFHDTDGDLAHEDIEKAFLDDYRAFCLNFIATQPVDNHQVPANALLAVALMTAYIDADEDSAHMLLSHDADPEQVMAALNGLHDNVVRCIAEVEQISFEAAATSFDNSFLL